MDNACDLKSELDLAADALTAALEAVPAEDWCRTWVAERTIMLRMTSKRVKEVVDKMRLPAVVALSRSFWFDDPRRDTAPQRMKRVLAQLATMPARCHITTLVMSSCSMRGHEEEILAGILAQCPELVHLDLSENFFGADGSGRLAGVLAQCPALAHLNLMGNQFEQPGQRGSQECWRSAQRWPTSISATMQSQMKE
jgi:hypothetical protein